MHCSNKDIDMKQEKIKMEVTAEEQDLIEAIRNYCNSYPNGYPQLLEYAQDIFDRMTDMPKKWQQTVLPAGRTIPKK